MPLSAGLRTTDRVSLPPASELVELVTDYLEGALPEEDHGNCERHLAECADCARYLDEMRVTIATVGQITIDSVPPEVRRAALDAFRDWSPGR